MIDSVDNHRSQASISYQSDRVRWDSAWQVVVKRVLKGARVCQIRRNTDVVEEDGRCSNAVTLKLKTGRMSGHVPKVSYCVSG